MFGTVLTVVFTALTAYVLSRAATVPLWSRRVSRGGVVALGIVIWAVFVLGRFVGHDGTGTVATALEFAGMTLLGTVFLVSICMLAVDLVTLFGFVLRQWAPKLRGLALLAGAALAGFAIFQGMRAPEVSRYEVELAGLPAQLDGTVLVAVSDAHLGSQLGEAWLNARVEAIQALQPDMVLLLGDMFEGHGAIPGDLASLRQLSAPLGKWAVNGNHESHRRGENGTSALLAEAGFHVLEDESVEVVPGLVLAGVSDLTAQQRRGLEGDPVGEALAGRPKGATVLLSHTPWEAERAAQEGVGLMLSGHTHGGQIWPLGYLVQTVYPLLAGRYEVHGMTAIVSRGMGTWGPRMRLWKQAEILVITLRVPVRDLADG